MMQEHNADDTLHLNSRASASSIAFGWPSDDFSVVRHRPEYEPSAGAAARCAAHGALSHITRPFSD